MIVNVSSVDRLRDRLGDPGNATRRREFDVACSRQSASGWSPGGAGWAGLSPTGIRSGSDHRYARAGKWREQWVDGPARASGGGREADELESIR